MSRISHLVSGVAILSSIALGESLLPPGTTLHLRSGDVREWRTFPASSQGRMASVKFQAQANATEHTLVLRQRDVKNLTWVVAINGQKLGVLQDDERDMLRALQVPAQTLRSGLNTLQITGEPGRFSDDIEITEIDIQTKSLDKWLREATLAVAAGGEQGPMPVKLTVVNAKGSLVPFASLRPGAFEARRTGVLYTPDGIARIGLPAGEYRIFASRGFEYSAPSERVTLLKDGVRESRLRLRREVKLSSHVSCDTHVHTFELSRHGDASVEERVLTAAGEGLDIIIATEHNRVDDYSPALARRSLDRWTLSVPGNEVTTGMGHFNIFPARPGTIQPDPREADWSTMMNMIQRTEGVQVIVQNHPRDLHSNYRPFDPSHHLSSVGSNLGGRPVRANAMEVVNSGAMSSDPLQLVRDWLGLLTRGTPVAAIGASDTHTVDFVPIGQARTYIDIAGFKSKWRDNTNGVFRSLAEGRNLVSYGLAAELRVTGSINKAGTQSRVPVEVTVHGPSWSAADQLAIYSNGHVVWQDSFAPNRKAGVKYRKKLNLALSRQDAALVTVATGPGVLQPFWEVRKPYQPTSDDWKPMVIGISSAVWVDGDDDGSRTAPLAHAERLVATSAGDINTLIKQLSGYDRAVTLHALDLLRSRGIAVTAKAVASAPDSVREAYDLYTREIGQVKADRVADIPRNRP